MSKYNPIHPGIGRLSGFFILLSILLVFTACSDSVDDPPPVTSEMGSDADIAAAIAPETGRQAFMRYCTSCHGQDAKGVGPASDILTVPATDLTMLSVNAGGEFPMERVMAKIDGREEVRGHNSTREMPVWANVWTDEHQEDAEEVVAANVDLLLDYIKSIQVTQE